jgi:hypothetical protein
MELAITINLTSKQAIALNRIMMPVAMGAMVGEFGQTENDAVLVENLIKTLQGALNEVQG